MKKILTGILGLLVAAGGVWFFLQYNKPHREASSEEPVAQMTAEALYNAYSDNEQLADSLWLDKVLAVEGIVSQYSSSEEPTLFLQTGSDLGYVACTFSGENTPTSPPAPGTRVQVKGICAGYTMDVVLVRCQLITP